MQRLDDARSAIRAVRDCESVRRLCLDCWAYGVKHGEEAGLSMARVVHAGVVEYQRYNSDLLRRWPIGNTAAQ